MATTTNYGWDTPDDTDLVKDGAAAIRTLGSSVDTTTKALNPSTTLGDIEYRSATANTNTRLAIGSTGNVLTVTGGVPTWAAPAGGGATNWTLLNTGGTTLTGAATITVSGLPANNRLFIIISAASSASASSFFGIRFNSDSGTNYDMYYNYFVGNFTYSASSINNRQDLAQDQVYVCKMSSGANSTAHGGMIVEGANSTGIKLMHYTVGASRSNNEDQEQNIGVARYSGASVISSVSILSSSGNFDAGTLFIYGAN